MNRFPPAHWLRRHPLAADSILAVVLAIMAQGAMWVGSSHLGAADAARFTDPNALGAALALMTSLPLALRRRAPIAVLVIVASSQFAIHLVGFFSAGWIPIFVATYSLAAHTSGRRRAIAGQVFAVSATAMLIAGFVLDHITVGEALTTFGFLVGSFVLGDNLQRRRRQVGEAAERAVTATRERDLRARQQVQDERARIARELHDVVAHSVSLMIIQAGAARRSITSSPLQAESALHELEATGRHAMDELRRVLGVLRTGDADDGKDDASGAGRNAGIHNDRDLAPQPTLASLPALVANDSTLHVRLTEVGTPPAVIPSSVGLSLYRIVQEALTNVRKHAGLVKTVEVEVSYGPRQVSVQISDDGRGASADLERGGGDHEGHGLIGMRERMALCGGAVTAGPRSGGGWRVRATAPLAEEAVEDNVAGPGAPLAELPVPAEVKVST